MLGCAGQVMVALNQDRYDILYGGFPEDQASALIFTARRLAHAKEICERAWEAGRSERLRLWRSVRPSSGHIHRALAVQPRPRSRARSRSPPRHVGEVESSNSSHADGDQNEQLRMASEGVKMQYLTYVGGVNLPVQIVHWTDLPEEACPTFKRLEVINSMMKGI